MPDLTLDGYQQLALRTAVYPNLGGNLIYPTLGLAGEAGEFANQVKKIQRDDTGLLTQERRIKLIDELGDVLWYLALLCHELETDLGNVAEYNLDKLQERYGR